MAAAIHAPVAKSREAIARAPFVMMKKTEVRLLVGSLGLVGGECCQESTLTSGMDLNTSPKKQTVLQPRKAIEQTRRAHAPLMKMVTRMNTGSAK